MTLTLSVTAGPTMTNPDKLDTVEDLRCELHRANKLVLDLSATLAKMNATGAQMAGFIEHFLKLYIRDDVAGITSHCEAYLSTRSRLRENLEEAIESENLRRMH